MKSRKMLLLMFLIALFGREGFARGMGGGHGSGGFHGGGFHGGGFHGSGGFHGHNGFHGHGGEHHGHSSFGFYFGAPFYPYPYYPYGYHYYYPPTVITVPLTPPVYIEQSKPSTGGYPAGYWYYCVNPEGYYPYVKDCPGGWQQVEPAPSAPK